MNTTHPLQNDPKYIALETNIYQDDENQYYKVLTDDEIQALRARNQARLKVILAEMGETYLCHPKNQIQPKV